MSGIVKYDDLSVVSELPAIFSLAQALVKAPGFMPPHLRNEGEITAVVLAGRELGIPPMASIRSIRLIKGNVTIDAAMQLALMVRAGCRVTWLDDGSTGVARLQLERPGQDPHVSRFTIDDAKLAGLASGDNWKRHPAAMLRARCVTAAGKAYCPDVLAGVYLPDELDDSPRAATADTVAVCDAVTGDVIDAPQAERVPTKDELISMLVDTDLPQCLNADHLTAWARELLDLTGKVSGSAPWKAFSSRCESIGVSPREIVNAALSK